MDFREILQSLDIPFVESDESSGLVTEGWLGLVCPYCGEGTGKHGMGLNVTGGYASCWKCGPARLVQLLMDASHRPYREVAALLEGVEFDRATTRRAGSGVLKMPPGVGPMQPAHKRFLQSRGLDPEEVEKTWGVQGIGISSRMGWSLFIPVIFDGKTVSWTTRSIARKYYSGARDNEEAIPRKSLLYGEDLARHAVVVVEGPIDAWAVGPGAVATLGVGYSMAQALRIARYPVRCVCMDAEELAQKRAHKLCKFLMGFPGQTHRISLSSGKDPSRANKQELNELVRKFLT